MVRYQMGFCTLFITGSRRYTGFCTLFMGSGTLFNRSNQAIIPINKGFFGKMKITNYKTLFVKNKQQVHLVLT